jgi:hypothetical protein
MDETTEWTTAQMQEEFTVMGFALGMCVVKRKSDGQVGTLTFHQKIDDDGLTSHRVYTGWVEDH